MTVQLPTHLTEAVKGLGVAASTLAEEVRTDRRARADEIAAERAEQRRRDRRMTALLAVLVVVVAGLATLSVSNRLLGHQNRAIQQQIADCTTETGQCAQESARRTGAAVAELHRRNRADLLAVMVCHRTAGGDDTAFEECVRAALGD